MADSDFSSKSPAFQFYPSDFVGDSNVAGMSLHERGAYITLICYCWIDGTLPDDTLRLSRLCGVPLATFRRLWPSIESCFRPSAAPHRLIHPRLERERQKQAEYRHLQSLKGKASGASRNRKATGDEPETNRKATGDEPETNRKATGDEPEGNRNPTLLSSSSSLYPAVGVADAPTAGVAIEDEDLDLGAVSNRDVSAFIRRFCELYAKHRFGAKYLIVRQKHIPLVRALLRVFPLPRLEKIAIVLLTTDDEWITRTDRGIGILSLKASWIDGRIAEYEAAHGEIQVAAAAS